MTRPLARRAFALSIVLGSLGLAAILAGGFACSTSPSGPNLPNLGDYVLIGWNDLGMHCANKNFGDLAVLPPYNNVWATLIRRGDDPQIVGAAYSVTYTFPANTYSVGKTDFWSYENLLFGRELPDNIGLTGKGLSGELDWTASPSGHYEARGIPITPYDDINLGQEQPYQLAMLEAYDGSTLLASTEIVVPISNEMRCVNCHEPEQGETVEHQILRKHDELSATDLVNSRPVLCATCHGSNALGIAGDPGLDNLSLAMHSWHADKTDDCYQCHPGPNTQCLRDVHEEREGMWCTDCHGDLANVASTIEQGREPWLQEPRCDDCHDAAYAEAPNTLYRNSYNGHHGLYCTVCHGSPHAILPSREERDNRQNTVIQGHAGTLNVCAVCHKETPDEAGPHGLSGRALAAASPAPKK
jgi:hypothetical protein